MNIIFELNHPKHYYQYKYLINYYNNSQDNVLILARDKDVLLKVLDEEGHKYNVFGKHGKSLFSKITFLPKLLISYLKIIWQFKPNYILSKASVYAALLKPIIKAKLVITPDSEVVWVTKKLVAPLSDIVITPETYKLNHGKNHKRVSGFFEETYLSPLSFSPDETILRDYNLNKPFFVLRFISWDANHDVGNWGFSDEQKIKLCDMLSKFGQVLVSAERNKIPSSIQKYIIKIPPSKIHHVIHYANMYIGDSQTMATESALLGTPSFRFNSFVGKNDMSNFVILQEKQLLSNFSDFDKLCKSIISTVENSESKNNWLDKRNKFFNNKIDINKQIIDIIKK